MYSRFMSVIYIITCIFKFQSVPIVEYFIERNNYAKYNEYWSSAVIKIWNGNKSKRKKTSYKQFMKDNTDKSLLNIYECVSNLYWKHQHEHI